MSNLSPFNNPFMLGFDQLENILFRVAKGADSFPPYNVEQLSQESLRITMAVAGYTEQDLRVSQEDNQLIVRGAQERAESHNYLHRGIAARTFIKSFVLADGMKIEGAFLENGLLNVDLVRPPQKKKVRQIEIKKSPKTIHVLKDVVDE